ncbi:peptidylprolyl isomerase [Halocola ammonii]
MKLKFSAFILALPLLFSSFGAEAQDKQVLMTVGGEDVTLQDFESIYRKNNNDSAITKEALDEYLELFVNFKLKVHEARQMGLDTMKSFKRELSGYRQQLARPYLTDEDKLDELVRQAYERMKQEVKASHILVKLDKTATPQDTLEAYSKIMEIRKRVTEGGEDFGKVASKVSEDPSAARNQGDLGYFSTFQMVYPFEDAAYSTEVGEVSKPVRTQFGYHILKVHDKREARGEVKVAHIMIKDDEKTKQEEGERAEAKIKEIYDLLEAGADFSELALKHSEDRSSARKGGELPWFGTGKMVEEFEDVSFSLERPGQISEPFKTSYGWHIVKKIDEKSVPKFEDVKSNIKTQVSRDARAEITKNSFLRNLKDEYNFEIDKKRLDPIYDAVDSTIFVGKLNVKKEKKLNKDLITFADMTYTAKDFYEWVQNNPPRDKSLSPKDAIDERLEKYADSRLMMYEEAHLDEKYDKFRLLMNEYRDGILLFELMELKVWNRAVKDTAGLEAYFADNRENYQWPKRIDGKIYKVANEKLAGQLRKMIKQGADEEAIYNALNKESELNVSIDKGVWSADDKPVLGEIDWEKGLSENVNHDGQIMVVQVDEVLEPAPMELNEARGRVMADYQQYLEKQWLEELRDKYEVTINKDVLYSIL